MCLPFFAHAADAQILLAHNPSHVIMMIGGMTDASSTIQGSSSISAANSASPSDSSDRLSVVMQSDGATSVLSRRPATSVVSRIMALAPMINEAAHAADVDSALLMAVIDVESGGNPQAVSPKGATGLMQLMPSTGARHGASDLFDPRQNVAAGARYLRRLMLQFGDLQLALAAYNAGEGAVQKYGGQIPPYAETMSYVPKVIGRYMHYRNATSSTNEVPAQAATQVTQGRFLPVRQSAGSN
ncbi:Membrane-bound lytic murein transglycosylase F [Paraburkholderia domus]|nr:Membrane-bound lytic murein transglycosylase F [Paraburkholderia domus]